MAVSFDFQQRLGVGHFGDVWRVVDTGLNAQRALKLIPQAKVLNPTNFFHEAQILKSVEHPNVVRVEDTGQLSDGRVYVSMEYLAKGSLEDEAQGSYIELSRAKRLMIDVLRGLEHAHSRGVLHRDIKPANILIGDKLEGKLSDFGLAIPIGMDLSSLGVMQYAYVLHSAPELFGAKTHSTLSDIYACGVTLYRIVNGDTFFNPPAPHELAASVRSGKFPDRDSFRDFVPLSLRRVIRRALAVDANARFPSAAAMRRALEQIVIEKNWVERTLSNGSEWVCGWDKKCYEIQCVSDTAGKWHVSVRKGSSRATLRRLTELCKDGLSEEKAKQNARRLLQDFVLGKIV